MALAPAAIVSHQATDEYSHRLDHAYDPSLWDEQVQSTSLERRRRRHRAPRLLEAPEPASWEEPVQEAHRERRHRHRRSSRMMDAPAPAGWEGEVEPMPRRRRRRHRAPRPPSLDGMQDEEPIWDRLHHHDHHRRRLSRPESFDEETARYERSRPHVVGVLDEEPFWERLHDRDARQRQAAARLREEIKIEQAYCSEMAELTRHCTFAPPINRLAGDVEYHGNVHDRLWEDVEKRKSHLERLQQQAEGGLAFKPHVTPYKEDQIVRDKRGPTGLYDDWYRKVEESRRLEEQGGEALPAHVARQLPTFKPHITPYRGNVQYKGTVFSRLQNDAEERKKRRAELKAKYERMRAKQGLASPGSPTSKKGAVSYVRPPPADGESDLSCSDSSEATDDSFSEYSSDAESRDEYHDPTRHATSEAVIEACTQTPIEAMAVQTDPALVGDEPSREEWVRELHPPAPLPVPIQDHMPGADDLTVDPIADEDELRAALGGFPDAKLIERAIAAWGESPTMASAILQAIARLCYDDARNADQLSQVGADLFVISALNRFPTKASVLGMGLLAIHNLSRSPHVTRQLMGAGVVQAITLAMRSFSANADICAKGIACLWSVADSPEHRRVVGESGGVDAVLTAARAHSSHHDVTHNALACLALLAASPFNLPLMGERDALDTIAHLTLQASARNDARLAGRGVAIFSTLAKDHRYMSALLRSSAMTCVLRVMNSFPHDENMLARCNGAITNLSWNPELAGVAVQNGAVQLILASIRAYMSPAMATAGLMALNNLAVSRASAVHLERLGAVPAIITVMRTFPREAVVQLKGLSALCAIAIPEQLKPSVARSGAIPVTLAAMDTHAGDSELQARGAALMWNLASDPGARAELAGRVRFAALARVVGPS